jgi:hypothetical protein
MLRQARASAGVGAVRSSSFNRSRSATALL